MNAAVTAEEKAALLRQPRQPAAINGIPQHDQVGEGEVMCLDFAGGQWICEVTYDEFGRLDELCGVKLDGRWYYPMELLSDAAFDALHDAIVVELADRRRIEREAREVSDAELDEAFA